MESLRRIRALLMFLRTGKPSLDDIMRFIALDTLFEFSVISLHLNFVRTDGTVYIPASFGCDPEALKLIPTRYVTSDTPFNRCLRTGEVGECGSIDDFPLAGPGYADKLYPHGFEYSFAWPVPGFGAVGTFCSRSSDLTIANQEFLVILGSILAFELGEVRHESIVQKMEVLGPKVEQYSLTQRQWDVLAGLRTGKTNAEIAQEIGFSESLVRQETVQIYRKLGVSGRKDIQALDVSASLQGSQIE